MKSEDLGLLKRVGEKFHGRNFYPTFYVVNMGKNNEVRNCFS